MSLGKEIKKIENFSREEKIKFYENVFTLIELGNTTIYEYKEIFGLDDVEDKYILREVKKVIEALTLNYKNLFESEELPEGYRANLIKIRDYTTKEIKRIISYKQTINNLPVSVGYINRKNNTEVIYKIEESDIQSGIYEVYKNNEYICARTVKESILRQLKQISDKNALLEEYEKLSDEEKQIIKFRKNIIPSNVSETAKSEIITPSIPKEIYSVDYNAKPRKSNKSRTKSYKMLKTPMRKK